MESDVEGLICVGRHERPPERLNYRNGYRDRTLDALLGTLALRVPKLRQGAYFPPFLEPRRMAETLEPGSSVSIVARRHDVNANQLFKWRHELAGLTPAAATLVPVSVMSEPATGPVAPKPALGQIEIMLSVGVRVRIEGAVDPATVSAAMAAVLKARRRR